MSNPTLINAAELSDTAQGPSTAFVPTNQRVTSGNMPLSVLSDVPTYPGTPALTVTGTWMMAGTRVSAGGMGLINSSSIGVGYSPVPAATGALTIKPGNQNVLIKF